jgi:hypothetical protein
MSGNCDFPVGSEEIEVDFAGAGIVKNTFVVKIILQNQPLSEKL